MMRATIGVLLIASTIAACSSKQEEQAEAPPMKVEDTVFGDMTQTMDRAKSVEGTTMQHKEDVDKALEADGG
ncbi:MAG: hypothetical protein ABW110_05320 [Steroidobacteraceae bacterium]